MNDDQKNPYVGPRTFLKEEGHLFFGRDREARDLLSLVASEQLVLFYAQSGAGKSSLINTRLIPGLEGKKFEVFRVGRVGGDRPPGVDVQNIYVFNLLRSLVQREVDPDILSQLPLCDFLARLHINETGYFYSDAPVEGRENSRRALVIDQFEELFSTHAESWEQREDFFLQLAQAMEDDPYLWVVLVMREDYIAALDPYAHLLPGGLRTRYYMQRLSRESAIKAVRKPVETIRPYEEGVAEKLVDDLSRIKVQKPDGTQDFEPGQYVEPVQLQVVCYGLWQNLPTEGTHISERDLLEVGDVDEALGKYYAGRIAGVAKEKHVKERLIRDWIEKKLIAPGGIRSMVMRETGRKSSGIRDDVIQALQSDLLRAENRGGAIWYELTHDRLVGPILENNKAWFNENLSPLQRQAALWKEQGQNETWLFSDQVLVEVEDWAKEHQDELTDVETEFLEECQAKQKEKEQRDELKTQQQKLIEEQKLVRQRRVITYISIIAVIVMTFLTVFSFNAQKSAAANENLARTSLILAQADIMRDKNFQLSALLSIEAYLRDKENIQSTGALLNTLLTNFGRNKSLNGHSAEVLSADFSPDGKTLASGSQDQTIILWDVTTGKPIAQPLSGHTDYVTSVAFSPDGKTLASGSYDQTVILWNVTTGKPIGQPLRGHNGPVSSVAFRPDGKTLASGSYDQTIILWDVATGKPIGQSLIGHSDYVTSVAFSPDGKTLASGSYDQTIILWDVATGKPTAQPLSGHTDYVTSVAFSPDGKTLASGSYDQTIILWDVATGEPISQPLKEHTNGVTSVAFSPDGKTLASGSQDQTIILWDVARVEPISQPLKGHTNGVTSIAFNPDGKTLASGSQDQTVILWNVARVEPISQPLIGQRGPILSLSFSPDGKTLASGSQDQSTMLWEMTTRHQIGQPLTGHGNPVSSVMFSPDGKTLASGSYDQTIILWDVSTGKPIGQPLKGHTNGVTSVAFSPDGKTLASGSYDQTIILWDVATGKPIGQPLKGHTNGVTSVAFSPDGKTLASGSYDQTIILWDVATGKPIGQPLSGHTDYVTSVAFSPDGKTLASGSQDQTIILWDVATGKPIGQPLSGHTDYVTSVAFSPDGKTLASGSQDQTIILWDVARRLPIGQPLPGHEGSILSVSYSPDGKTLASGSYDQAIILWDLDARSWIEKACQLAGRNLTFSEWEQYFSSNNYRATCQQGPPEGQSDATAFSPEITSTASISVSSSAVPTGTRSLTRTPTATATLTRTPTVTSLLTGNPTAIATPTAISLPTASPVSYSVINVKGTDRLNIRGNAGYNYDVIAKIPNDTKDIQVTGIGVQADNTIWLPVIYHDISGWIDSYYLSPSRFVGFNVYAVDINGSGSEATVSPGARVVVRYDFQVFNDPSCPSCIAQLVTGMGISGSHGGSCAYNSIPGVFPGEAGSENTTLIAPMTPGTYFVVVEYHWQFTCDDALTNYGSGGAVPPQKIGQIIVK